MLISLFAECVGFIVCMASIFVGICSSIVCMALTYFLATECVDSVTSIYVLGFHYHILSVFDVWIQLLFQIAQAILLARVYSNCSAGYNTPLYALNDIIAHLDTLLR